MMGCWWESWKDLAKETRLGVDGEYEACRRSCGDGICSLGLCSKPVREAVLNSFLRFKDPKFIVPIKLESDLYKITNRNMLFVKTDTYVWPQSSAFANSVCVKKAFFM